MTPKKHKIIVAVTGASGAIYAKVLFDKLIQLKDQIETVGVVFSGNAKDVWEYDPRQKRFLCSLRQRLCQIQYNDHLSM